MFAPPTSAADLTAAFRVVFGADAPIVETIKTPGGHEELAAAPFALVPLGGLRFALVIREANGMLSHSAVGATSIAYLTRGSGAAGDWRRIGMWPQIALNGETGGLTLEVRRDLGQRPLLIVSGPTMFTGDGENDAIVIRLDPDKPAAVGRVSLQSSNDDVLDERFARHRYSGRILPAKGSALFAVRYDGWRADAGSPVKQPFHGTVAYGLRNGCLAALGPLPAPEITVSYAAPTDCGPARAAP